MIDEVVVQNLLELYLFSYLFEYLLNGGFGVNQEVVDRFFYVLILELNDCAALLKDGLRHEFYSFGREVDVDDGKAERHAFEEVRWSW